MLLVLCRYNHLLCVHCCLVDDIQAESVHFLVSQDCCYLRLFTEGHTSSWNQVARCTILLVVLLEIEKIKEALRAVPVPGLDGRD